MLFTKESYGFYDHGWLKTFHHFSFGDYYNPSKMNIGVLRVLNDDIIKAHTGFPKHPHKNMEILTYVIHGELSHADSMGHEKTVTRGNIQYMSAGTGVYHSEYNHSDKEVRLLQIWIYPNEDDYPPNYGDASFSWEDRVNKWLQLVGPKGRIQMHQDVNIYVTYLEEGEMTFELNPGRQAYIVQIEGESTLNDQKLKEQEAYLHADTSVTIKGHQSHMMVIEMAK